MPQVLISNPMRRKFNHRANIETAPASDHLLAGAVLYAREGMRYRDYLDMCVKLDYDMANISRNLDFEAGDMRIVLPATPSVLDIPAY